MKPRGIVTTRLSDVLQALQLAHKTGLLAVERAGSGGVIEQGTITFHNGQMTDASVGPYMGAAALGVLSRWSSCCFTFHTPSAGNTPSTGALTERTTTGNLQTLDQAATPQTSPLVPYRLYSIDEALPSFPARGLTRAHRQLFLLIDGKRTMQELIRLTGRLPREVEALLTDLERTGFIRQ